MKTINGPRFICLALLALCSLTLTNVFAKDDRATNTERPRFYSKVPWGVNFNMEGTVTNVVSKKDRIEFRLTGRFWFSQYPPESRTPVTIEVHGKGGFSAVVSQAKPFFAMTTDWRGGAIRKDGELLKILKAAAERGNVVKFELAEPKMEFGPDQSFKLTHATVVRATDADLR